MRGVVTHLIRCTTRHSCRIRRVHIQVPSHPNPFASPSTPPTVYDIAYEHSLADPESFWGLAAQDIHWSDTGGPVLSYEHTDGTAAAPYDFVWFRDRQLNTAYNALDVHLTDRGNQTAIIYESPVTKSCSTLTYRQLYEESATLAGALQAVGVQKGDVVLLYLPMIPAAICAILACARIGAVHSVVFGGFAALELGKRIADSKPKLILSASCGIEGSKVVPYKPMLDAAIAIAKHTPQLSVVFQRPQHRAALERPHDMDWSTFVHRYGKIVPPVIVKATDPLYLLYTSGTTGMPKGVVRENGGHAVALKWSMRHLYDMKPGEVWMCGSDIGWVVGHSYIVYAPLFLGCTSILYEGKPVGTPDAGEYWRVIERHRAKSLFTAPTALRAIKKEDPQGRLINKSALKAAGFEALFVAGERGDPASIEWSQHHLGVPVIDHYWQTESGWPMIANCKGLHAYPIKPGSPTKPLVGYHLRVLDDDGKQLPRGAHGNLVMKLPLPPCCFRTLWQDHQRYVKSYMTRFHGYYDTSDAGYIDDDGFVYVMGRTDDIMNVAGHRLSSGQMEEVIGAHAAVAECAVVGIADSLKGQTPIGLIVLKNGVTQSIENIRDEIVAAVRASVGAVASLKTIIAVKRLPKTRSGKILRALIRAQADGTDYKVPPTIDDESVVQEIKDAVKGLTQ